MMEYFSTHSQTRYTPISCLPQAKVVRHLHEPRPKYEPDTETTRAHLDAHLDLSGLLGCQEDITSLTQMAIDRDWIVYLLQVASWRGSSFVEQRLEATVERQSQLEEFVVSEFATVPEVALVYSDRYRAEYTFSIFVRGDQYNDAVMDALLDRELRVVRRFALLPITFHYLPYVHSESRRELVRQAARLIFEG